MVASPHPVYRSHTLTTGIKNFVSTLFRRENNLTKNANRTHCPRKTVLGNIVTFTGRCPPPPPPPRRWSTFLYIRNRSSFTRFYSCNRQKVHRARVPYLDRRHDNADKPWRQNCLVRALRAQFD